MKHLISLLALFGKLLLLATEIVDIATSNLSTGLCHSFPNQIGSGGWSPVDVNDEVVKTAALKVIDEMNEKVEGGCSLELANLMSAKRQMIRGVKLELNMAMFKTCADSQVQLCKDVTVHIPPVSDCKDCIIILDSKDIECQAQLQVRCYNLYKPRRCLLTLIQNPVILWI